MTWKLLRTYFYLFGFEIFGAIFSLKYDLCTLVAEKCSATMYTVKSKNPNCNSYFFLLGIHREKKSHAEIVAWGRNYLKISSKRGFISWMERISLPTKILIWWRKYTKMPITTHNKTATHQTNTKAGGQEMCYLCRYLCWWILKEFDPGPTVLNIRTILERWGCPPTIYSSRRSCFVFEKQQEAFQADIHQAFSEGSDITLLYETCCTCTDWIDRRNCVCRKCGFL